MDNITFNLIQENTDTGEKLILIFDITLVRGEERGKRARLTSDAKFSRFKRFISASVIKIYLTTFMFTGF